MTEIEECQRSYGEHGKDSHKKELPRFVRCMSDPEAIQVSDKVIHEVAVLRMIDINCIVTNCEISEGHWLTPVMLQRLCPRM